MNPSNDDPAIDEPLDDEAQLRRLTAAAQHALNNPLSALLAEVQLLLGDPTLSEEQRTSLERVQEITRRIIGLVRSLETAVRERDGH